MKPFWTGISAFKKKLTRLDDQEPVSGLALAVIILLDIFVLSVIFGGLDKHAQQLTSPSEYFPYACRNVFLQDDWTQANKIENLQRLILIDYNNYSYLHESPFELVKLRRMHPLCRKFYENLRAIADKDALKSLFVDRQRAEKRYKQLSKQYARESNVYNTALLERMAGEDSPKKKNIATSVKAQGVEINRLKAQIQKLNEEINANPLVKEFWQLARPEDETQREKLIGDLNRFERFYLFRQFFWKILFLLPLFAIFFFWHKRSITKDRRVRGLLSAHLLVVASIPILLEMLHLILELIPTHFFKELFKWMERLHLVALWYYLSIILAVAGGLFLIFIIQKKIFTQKRLHQKRLTKGMCPFCGKKLPDSRATACPFCGEALFRECGKCQKPTYLVAPFCIHCGEKNSSLE
jgi:hypothetical protein